MDITEWQKRFLAGPRVWVVEDGDGEGRNYYDSQEAAQAEVLWRRQRGDRGYRVRSEPIHTLDLSRERWKEAR